MLYVDLCHGAESVALRLDVGSRIPIESSAAGFAFLAGSKPKSCKYYVQQLEKKYAKDWPGIRRQINKGMKEARENGFCIACGLVEPTVNAAAAPIVAPNGQHVLAVNCTGPSFQLTKETLSTEIGPRLANLVGNVKAEMARHGFN